MFTEKDNNIHCMDFDNRGKVFCTGGTDLDVRAYDAKTHKVESTHLPSCYF